MGDGAQGPVQAEHMTFLGATPSPEEQSEIRGSRGASAFTLLTPADPSVLWSSTLGFMLAFLLSRIKSCIACKCVFLQPHKSFLKQT